MTKFKDWPRWLQLAEDDQAVDLVRGSG